MKSYKKMNVIDNYFKQKNYNRIVYNLDNIKELIKLSGIDLSLIKFIHITGSKGKGSTSFYISEFLQTIGLNTGLFTSPHIMKNNERIKINGIDISDKEIKTIFFKYEHIIQIIKPTYFELLTFIAYVYFSYKKVEWAIIEVGLGGRYDATNIINSIISIITCIELEHQQYLGNTKLKILKEKAEIIKKNSITIVNIKEKILLNYLNKISIERNVKLYNIYNETLNIDNICNNVVYQKPNIKAALKVINILADKYEYKFDNENIQNIISNKTPFGRFSMIKKINNIPVIIDAAHTKESIKTLIKTIKLNKFINPIFIFNCLSDKNYEKIISEIEKISKLIILLKLKNTDRVIDYGLLKKSINTQKNRYIYTDNLKTLSLNKNKYYDLIIAAGSFYLIEEVIYQLH